MEGLLEQCRGMIREHSELRESSLSYFVGKVLEFRTLDRALHNSHNINQSLSGDIVGLINNYFLRAQDRSNLLLSFSLSQSTGDSSEEATKTSAESLSPSRL